MLADITVHIEENIGRIEMHRAPSNIIDFSLMEELYGAIDQTASCHFLILSSSLNHFSTGVDIKLHTPDHVPAMLEAFHKVIRKLYHFPGTTICLLHGYALGGGLELALVCDFLFSEKKAMLGFPEIRLACYPPVAAVLLPRFLGWRANRMLFTGEAISSPEAQEMNLIQDVFDEESRKDFLENFLKKISGHSKDALRILKKVIRESCGFDFDKELDVAEKYYVTELIQSPEMAEGIQAYLEKRPPKYRP